MLNAISWQQYIVAVLLCSAAWYAYIGLRFYRPGIAGALNIKTTPKTLTPAVMGAARPETGTGLLDPEQAVFSGSQTDDISDQTLPKGPGDELLAEAHTLVEAYADTDNKPEFLSLLKLLIGKYEVFGDEISLPVIISSLKSVAQHRLPFSVRETEWPLNF